MKKINANKKGNNENLKRNKKNVFLSPVPRIIQPKNVFPRSKAKDVLCSPRTHRQTDRQTNRQTHTKVNAEDTLSGFQFSFNLSSWTGSISISTH